MKNFISKTLFIALAMAFMVGCAMQGPTKPFVEFTPNSIDGSQYSLKHENFLVILDGSSSYGRDVRWKQKI